ncbi:unnamed protein product [Sphagnum troendelagicum]|uniref:CCR4-NOT transcription complex subunit 3 n=1 Tax=Sphagnum troendelagicum TaxID=128251 RepID=A0ABP0UR76_9BRYO
MGATRKLQGEIDRVLKKVQEGVDVFDSIWNKVYDTENANQKEKFEADLKKEIKKLQRYRDQIKTWIQSSEIKDKKVFLSFSSSLPSYGVQGQSLLDARKLIEREMERFKVCEKETKTKAFSKEGLGQQPKTDPKEKAKGESRDWLNNMVSELDSQIDSFEAEMEGLQVKKGKARPPRLTHLEDSIARHKLHIQKLELMLRLLDNDELSPEQVNDVKDFVEDYVERNQDNFEEFADVDEIYQSLPLVEALENLDAIPIVPPAIVVKEKVVASAVGVGMSPLVSPSSQSQILEDSATSEASAESPRVRTAPIPLLGSSPTTGMIASPQETGSVAAAAAAPVTSTAILSRGLGNPTNLSVLPGAAAVRPLPIKLSGTASALQHSVVSLLGRTKEEGGGIMGHRTGPSSTDGGLVRSVSRGAGFSMQSPPHVPLGVGGSLGSNVHAGASPPVLDLNKRLGSIGGDDRTGAGLSQELPNSLGAQSQPFVGTGAKLGESGSSTVDGTEGNLISGRLFTPPGMSGGHWRPHTASTLQAQQADSGQFHGRTEIAPDQKQKFLQRLQQVHQNQQGHGTGAALLGAGGSSQIPHLAAPMPKQSLGSQQQPAFLQQQHNSALITNQISSMPQQQPPLGFATSSQGPSQTSTPALPPQNLQLPAPQSSAQQLHTQQSLSSTTSSKQVPQQLSPQQAKRLEETTSDASVLSAVFARNVSLSEDDLKNADTFDVSIGGPGTLAEFSQLSRDADFAPGQVVSSLQQQPSAGPGVIGRRSMSDLGAIGDNLSPALGGVNASVQHDQLFNSQALEAAYRNLPLPKDSERPRSYIPRNRAATPSSYPQVQAPIVDNPALWERLDTDVLFFAFYYQQGTYQQYLAARELKKQSWRYHKKYNTWFQRHEEPKITTDEYEQGTYVYFDFHIVHDDFQQGWCQRIKTEFTFEYSYLEDELVV